MAKRLVFNFKMNEKDYQETLFCLTFGIQKWKRIALAVVWIASLLILVGNFLKLYHITTVIYTCCLMVVVIVGTVFLTTIINI
ncbi:MAG: hypothetical protein PUF67_07925, partial [Firmicutes bacterium]|nr:hypothetical protein [Bacillota bacterium]